MADHICTIGIDLGTSSVKAIAFDATMHEISSAAQNVESRHDDEGAAEQDPPAVYQAATVALSQAAQQARSQGYTIERVGLSAATRRCRRNLPCPCQYLDGSACERGGQRAMEYW